LAGADRVAMDIHPYFAFDTPSADPLSSFITKPCTGWGSSTANSMKNFGLTAAGEFRYAVDRRIVLGWIADALDSNAINDCGLYMNAVNVGTRYEGTFPGFSKVIGNCSTWTNWDTWDQTTKDGLKQFMMASMDALQVSSLSYGPSFRS
jgi:glucan 1,3-beta-glucosidase